MKVVKLNRRFKQFREHGHTVALRFPHYSPEIGTLERLVSKKLGGQSWDRAGPWCSYFGAANGHSDRKTFWITFRKEADLTFVLLFSQLTK